MRLLIFMSLIFFSYASYAQLVVTDPGALAKLVETVSQGQKMIKNMEDQIQTAQDNAKNFKGNLKRSQMLKLKLSEYKTILNNVQGAIPSLIDDQYIDNQGNIKDSLLNAIYDSYRKGGNVSYDMRKLYRQITAKAALEISQLSIDKATNRFAQLDRLAFENDSTNSLKDASDMTNKLLLRILMVLEQLQNMQAYLTRMQSSIHYSGMSQDASFIRANIPIGKKWELGITHGGNLFTHSKCTKEMKKFNWCN